MKICVLFPGVGYTVDRPLLYYTGKKARKMGYEIIGIRFHDLPKNIAGDEKKKRQAFEIAMEQTAEQLKSIDFDACEEILFAGKSIGTVVAAAYAKSLSENLRARIRFLYYTPLANTFSYAEPESGIVFTGTADPWVKPGEIPAAAGKLGLPCHIYENANHSLETGDVEHDIEILGEVIKYV